MSNELAAGGINKLTDSSPKKEKLFVIVPIECVFEEVAQVLRSKGQAFTEKEIMMMNHSCLGELINGNETLNRKLFECTRDHIQ